MNNVGVGDQLILKDDDDDEPYEVEVTGVRRPAKILEVIPADVPDRSRVRAGIVAITPNGGIWWIAQPEVLEPWESM